MYRFLFFLIITLVAASLAIASPAHSSAAIYDSDGNFISLSDLSLDGSPDGAISISVDGLPQFSSVPRYSRLSSSTPSLMIFHSQDAPLPYMILDDANFSLRLSRTLPSSVSDFDYAISFDPKDWARIRQLFGE